MTASQATTEVVVHLYPHGEKVPPGLSLKTLEGAEATMSTRSGVAEVHFALPDVSRTETRWMLGRVLAVVGDLTEWTTLELIAEDDIDDDTLIALALDLYHIANGFIAVPERVRERVAQIGKYETGFRDWVDEDPATRTSIAIAGDITEWASERTDVDVTVLDEHAAKELGLNLLVAVGQGSEVSPSRLVFATYKLDEGAPEMIVGKGVTFDTGGINTKPYESFVSMMKNDMAGAGVAYWLFRALVENNYDGPLVLVIPACENSVGAKSMRPGHVVKSYRGHTVRVDHTDAEGRLILADALAYASEKYNPSQVYTFATLTTASLVSYGPYATPVHFPSEEFEKRMETASLKTGEDMHFFPRRVWHAEANRDIEADLKNTARLPGNAVRGAGSRNAAHFLTFFTDAPLTHFDIFACTWDWSGEAPGANHGATGAPLRTLLAAFGVG